MKPSDIFCLIVRISGYMTVLYAGYGLVMAVIGPFDFTFGGFMLFATYAIIGLALMRIAPLIGAFAYPEEPSS